MVFGTGFDMGLHQKLLILTIVAPKSWPSSKRGLRQLVLELKKLMDSSGHQIFANPEFQSNRKHAQRHLEPGTPNIRPRQLSGPLWLHKKFVL